MSLTPDAINAKGKGPLRRGATRHCCYGLCNSDSRYSERDYMQGVRWLPFPKPHKDLDKCLRWVKACSREGFTVEKVTKWTYICTKHFIGGNGPTNGSPDPIPATYTPLQISQMGKKRKPPTPRANPVSKKLKYDAAEALLTLGQGTDNLEKDESEQSDQGPKDQTITPGASCSTPDSTVPSHRSVRTTATNTHTHSSSKETQTSFACTDVLSYKIDSIISKRTSSFNSQSEVEIFDFHTIALKENLFYFYTGLTVLQFQHLFSCLGDEVNNLHYWHGSKTSVKKTKKYKAAKRKVQLKDQLFLTLIKLRQDFPNRDLAYRFKISIATVSSIFNTWIQFLYVKTAGLRKRMFPSQQIIKENLPACFRSFKNVRVIIDCFEVFTQQPRNFSEQGNMYSSYKNHCTFKALVGIAPTGGISFLSDVYEGSISDKEIVKQSGLINLLNPGDLVIADRGFDIKDMLLERRVDLNIPPFLKNRDKLTPQEEILTKRIARVRIHVERAIERMKKFKIIAGTVPLSLKPMISQLVHVIGFLVNYQQPIVK